MNPDPNLGMVERIAAALGQLRDRVVFVGGSATGLLITDPLAAAIRVTKDVDVIVEVATHSGYYQSFVLQAKQARQGLRSSPAAFQKRTSAPRSLAPSRIVSTTQAVLPWARGLAENPTISMGCCRMLAFLSSQSSSAHRG